MSDYLTYEQAVWYAEAIYEAIPDATTSLEQLEARFWLRVNLPNGKTGRIDGQTGDLEGDIEDLKALAEGREP